jgi:hypothetical protein
MVPLTDGAREARAHFQKYTTVEVGQFVFQRDGIERWWAARAMSVLPGSLSTEGLQHVDESLGISESGSPGRAWRVQKNFGVGVLENLWGTGISRSLVLLSR